MKVGHRVVVVKENVEGVQGPRALGEQAALEAQEQAPGFARALKQQKNVNFGSMITISWVDGVQCGLPICLALIRFFFCSTGTMASTL